MSDTWITDLIGTLCERLHIGGLLGFRMNGASGDCDIETFDGTAKKAVGLHTVKVYGDNAAHRVGLTAPSGLSSDVDYQLPLDGSPGQHLITQGNGVLEFVDSVGLSPFEEESFTQATSSPLTVFTPPANAEIVRVAIEVKVAAAAGSPSVCVGIVGTPERYMKISDVNLLKARTYEVTPNIAVGASPAAVVLTIDPDDQTFEAVVRVWAGMAQ